MTRKLLAVFALTGALILPAARGVGAHPADVYFQTLTIALAPAGLQVVWEIKPGALLAQSIWTTADADQSGDISDEEAQGWIRPVLPELHAAFDGRPLGLQLQNVEWPASVDQFRIGDQTIRIHLSAGWPAGADQSHALAIASAFAQQSSINWFEVSSTNGVVFEAPQQDAGSLHVRMALSAQAADGWFATQRLTSWESGRPSIPAIASTLGISRSSGQILQQQGLSGVLDQLMRSQESTPYFYIAALLLAILTGALHALTPGHGKTIVAAYLVGSRGTIRHAVFLGATVTLTHTGSVFLLGAVTLAASQYILPTRFVPLLEIVSGLLIVGLGASLLIQRWRAWRAGDAGRDHGHEHHDHEHGHPHHDHDHDHGHEHRPDASAINLRTLLALGVSGGLVPCPEAIAILLLAITINRIALGLSLILAFSLGLALVLIAVGILMVKSKQRIERLGFLDRWATVIPMASALIVLGFGLVLTFGAARNISIAGPQPERVAATARDRFDLGRAGVIFSDTDNDFNSQLYRVPATGGAARQITHESSGIVDYSVSPDGGRLVYSSSTAGGSALWQLDPSTGKRTQLLACPQAVCSEVLWSQDAGRVLYSRLDRQAADPLGIPSVWWLDLDDGSTVPAFQDGRMPVLAPGWSPDGTWLGYTPVNSTAIQLFDLKTGAIRSVPTRTGSQTIWSPAGDSFLLTDVRGSGEGFPSKIYRYELAAGTMTELTQSQDFYEYDPGWSPDGTWISLLRHDASAGGLVFGDQIWLVHPDGSGLHAITTTDGIVHGRPAWSPDGRYLLYHYLVAGEGQPARIQILDIETGQTQEVAARGYGPVWMP